MLYLNVGELRKNRNIAEGDIDDVLQVRQIGVGKVRVPPTASKRCTRTST